MALIAAQKERIASPWGQRLFRLGLLLLFVEAILAATWVGVQARRWAWEYTMPIRHHYDVNRNFDFGRMCIEQGYLNVYENLYEQNKYSGDFSLNYPPLRLFTFYAWAKWAEWKFPGVQQWQENHQFNALPMYFNTALEWLGALAAYLLVRHWLRRNRVPAKEPFLAKLTAGGWRATAAFLLLWFNPAMIVSAHGWPSWDMWVVPFFLWALLWASWECWFISGLTMGIAVMFKGQQAFILPMFLLWPIFAGQPGRALRWLSGAMLAAALIVSPWMLSYRTEFNASSPSSPRIFDWSAFWFVAGCTVGVAVIVMLLRLKWRTRLYWVSGVLGASLLCCIIFFHASMAWWQLGFMYGTERHMSMVVGPGNNLCALLASHFNWHSPKEIALTIPAKLLFGHPQADIEVELRHFLFAIFVLLLVISCIAIAKQWRRGERRFLVAVLVPWLLFYTIPAQIHDRYLLFPAACAAILLAEGIGFTLLGIFLTGLTFLQTVQSAMQTNSVLAERYVHPFFNPDFYRFCDTLRPDISWEVLAITAVFFFAAFTGRRRNLPLPLAVTPVPDIPGTPRPL